MPSTAYHRLATANKKADALLPTDNDDDDGAEQLQLQQPTKLLGCLRTVGRPTSKANPLLVAAFYTAGESATISRVDLKLIDVASGATVARLYNQGNGHLGVAGDLLCNVGNAGTAAVSVLDPATGDVTAIPARATGDRTSSALVFGHVPATGQRKILRVFTADHHGLTETTTKQQRCEILTLDDGGDDGEQQRWRPAPSPPVRVDTLERRHRAVTGDGVAHFLIPLSGAERDAVASFDLATEQWRPTLLQVPLPTAERRCRSGCLSLVELYGCLAFVHPDYKAYAVDMWVLLPERPGEVRWRQVVSLPLEKILRRRGEEYMAKPLMVLEDGRIAFLVRAPYNVVRVYNPRTGGCLETVNFGKLTSIVGLYRGKLLGVN